ncbi:MAG: acetate--CoA ligase [Holosporales bacterium]|jgi:acetyl-CoA synthetase|nr:acetate--CoA ligase [Holosporales bacterium]
MTKPQENWLLHKEAWRDPEIYKELYDFSIEKPEEYWRAQLERLSWVKHPESVLEKNRFGNDEWFADGKINACYNCVDRHVEKNPEKIAVIWQSEKLDVCEKISFQKLKEEVCRFANTLKKIGLSRRDCITIYMPMIPEGIYACLACARLGIPYSAVFAGFAPSALASRMNDCKSTFIISCDASVRGGKIIPLKSNVDQARELCNHNVRSLIVRRQGIDIPWNEASDFDYYSVSSDRATECEIADTDSLSELFILYTSGSVGKPKGVVMGTGGYLLFSSLTHKYFFDIEDDSVFWGSGDIGWMGGHSYALYAPLCNGVTSVFFEGIPTYPRVSIFWEIIDKHQVTSFNTAPTAIRAMMKNSIESLSNTSRNSLKLIGVMGEILNKDAWHWYFTKVGNERCPLINMWGQTELGGVPTAPLCNLAEMKTYGHVGRQFFGCNLSLRNEAGEVITAPEKRGSLFIDHPLPGMLLRVYGNEHALRMLYYSQSEEGHYCTGDEAFIDHEGNYWITGRNDDVLNVSGHRISPIEIEETISISGIVAEVSVVGFPHPIKGEGIYAFVVLKHNISDPDRAQAKQIISDRVRNLISPITKPDVISIVSDLPKTRSGKIMRRILRRLASGDKKEFEDISTISNPDCINGIAQAVNEDCN